MDTKTNNDSGEQNKERGLPGLAFPPARLRLGRQADGTQQIWDPLRRQWLVLTPEEWVRQHLVSFLATGLGVPPAMISQECPVNISGMPQRADVVVYSRLGKPLLLAECKAPEIPVDAAVYAQAVRYNNVLAARYILITNGMKHYVYELTGDETYVALKEFPDLASEF